MRTLVVGTRKSKLALIQTKWVVKQLRKAGISCPIQVKEIDTTGDRNVHVALPKLGGGIFLEELEQELLNGTIDFAVHSLKDIPNSLPAGVHIASFPEREDHRDVFLQTSGITLEKIRPGAIIGTSSLRRAAQLLRVRPDVEPRWIRGPIDVRIQQMVDGDYDAIVLAMAGLKRLSIGQEFIAEILPTETFLPAMGQGALAIECREADEEVIGILGKINSESTEKAVRTERAFAHSFHEGDRAPIGAYAYVENGVIHLHGMVCDQKGERVLAHKVAGEDHQTVAEETAQVLLRQGAQEIITEVLKDVR
ncbi:MAG TPA: hydroxymethylbilane synthase [Bacillota bacterium]|nr:hydroxymethylbilane synthase [Bacillota bacterium]